LQTAFCDREELYPSVFFRISLLRSKSNYVKSDLTQQLGPSAKRRAGAKRVLTIKLFRGRRNSAWLEDESHSQNTILTNCGRRAQNHNAKQILVSGPEREGALPGLFQVSSARRSMIFATDCSVFGQEIPGFQEIDEDQSALTHIYQRIIACPNRRMLTSQTCSQPRDRPSQFRKFFPIAGGRPVFYL
jgi:hypothetical protein